MPRTSTASPKSAYKGGKSSFQDWYVFLLTIALPATFMELVSAIAACLSRGVQIDDEETFCPGKDIGTRSVRLWSASLSLLFRQDCDVAFPRAPYRPHCAFFCFCHGRGQDEVLQVDSICPRVVSR